MAGGRVWEKGRVAVEAGQWLEMQVAQSSWQSSLSGILGYTCINFDRSA